MKITKAKVTNRFDIHEDTGTPGVGGTYIGTTRGNGELPESVQRMDEENARVMAKAFEMKALLERVRQMIDARGISGRLKREIESVLNEIEEADDGTTSL